MANQQQTSKGGVASSVEPLRVQVNPDKSVGGKPIRVRNPLTGAFYPDKPFDMSAEDLRHPQVIRLFPRPGQPGGRAGGVFGDLVPVDAPAEPAKSAKTADTGKTA